MNRFFRGAFIVWTVWRFGLHELVLSNFKQPLLRLLSRILRLGRTHSQPRGERLRLAL
jgi:ubiquinone biosynthesis protein